MENNNSGALVRRNTGQVTNGNDKIIEVEATVTSVRKRKQTDEPALPRLRVISGPSKYDFVTSLSHRRQIPLQVVFKVEVDGKQSEMEMAISALLKSGANDRDETDSGLEGHQWKFFAYSPIVPAGPGHQQFLNANIIGEYSTKTRTGWVSRIGYRLTQLLHAAFLCMGAREDLASHGYLLPELTSE